ncbi:MAG: hypothetical protein Q9187_000002 [Circinaria calcarea]
MYFKAAYIWFVGDPIESLPGDEPANIAGIRKEFALALIGSYNRDAMGLLRYLYKNKKWVEACMFANKFADRLVDEALRQRRDYSSSAPDVSQVQFDMQGPKTLLQSLFQQFEDKAELRNEILQFFMAAPQTVAGLLTCVCSLLSQHPNVWRRLREEALQYSTKSCDYESVRTLRLYPSATLALRTASADTTLPVGGGMDGKSPIYVPKGTEVKINVMALHRVPSVFGPRPETFYPERWDFIRPKVWEYIPFGRGPRACLGKEKALVEAQFALAKLARDFKEIRCSPEDNKGIGAMNGMPERCNVVLIRA